ncbi:hypothetical protein DENSPDRAFT_567360 [Dentipellis sp. KUC8613]|nr:hypothetical protein DENSPDRAFT_567360 [Dentipellis sp. KUC8613]
MSPFRRAVRGENGLHGSQKVKVVPGHIQVVKNLVFKSKDDELRYHAHVRQQAEKDKKAMEKRREGVLNAPGAAASGDGKASEGAGSKATK